jgi:membrane-associated protease RseP (regulator of RpoE activity)
MPLQSTRNTGVISVLLPLLIFWGCMESDAATKRESSRRAWLGVAVQDLTPRLARSMDLRITEGALVSEVVKNSPADSAGIKEKDIIVEFAGRLIYDADDLLTTMQKQDPGTRVELTVVRKGEKKKIRLTLGKRPRRLEARVVPRLGEFEFHLRPPRIDGSLHLPGIGQPRQVLGLELMELNDQLAEYFQVPEGDGVLIKYVEKNSAAEKAGLKAGDIILSVGKKRVNDVGDVDRALRRYTEGDKVEIEILRKGSKKTVTVEIQEDDDLHRFHHYEDGRGEEIMEQITSGIRPHLDELRLLMRNLKPPRIELRDIFPVRPEPLTIIGDSSMVDSIVVEM